MSRQTTRQTRRGAAPDDIAIVGMACLFPGADTPARFWANICRKLELIGDPLPSWGAERYLGGTGPSHIPTARGGWLGEAFAADAAQLGVMPSSVDGGEPDQFLALRIAQAALADAGGLAPGTDHARTGIILGHSTYLHRGNAAVVQHGVVLDQTREILGQLLPGADPAILDRVRAAMAAALPPFNADIAPGLVPNVMTGRIANRLDLRGPNYLIDAACASALLAVQAAMVELRAGRSDLMLAGGVNASLPAEVYMVFNQLGALSGTGRVRPFAEGGDGTLLGEGLGILALRRLGDALDAGERIYAVLKGVGQSSDGKGSGLLAPRQEGERLAIERALRDAGQDPASPELPGLIECHGTGIPLGDRTEIAALRDILGGRAADGVPRTAIGSVKSMIGHCIPAAGAAGLIKASLALYYRTLPPTLAETLRPGLPIGETGLYVNTDARPWISAPDRPRRAAVNAFGFGGINAHAVLEEAPQGRLRPDSVPDPVPDPAPTHWPQELVLISADTPAALAARARDLIAAIDRHARAALSEIAARAVARAGTGRCRLALVAATRDDLADKLGKAALRLDAGKARFRLRSGVIASDRSQGGKLAFVFPGEGAQYQGMLAEVLMAFPPARAWFDFWDGLFPERALPPSASVFPPPTTLDPAVAQALGDRLFGLELGSESVFMAAQALLAVLTRLGIAPDAVVGHSSGEHSALAAAGVFGGIAGAQDRAEFADRIRPLNRLYREIEAAGGIQGGALLTVGGVARDRILALAGADPQVHLALDNCQHQAVLYGPRDRMERVAAELRPEGGICAFLPFDRPYHTPLFAEVAEKVAAVYARMDFRVPALPVWSCATVAPMPDDPLEIRALAAWQWATRVRFTETLEALHDDGVRIFLEVGPAANLTGFVEDTLKGRDTLALSLDSRRHGGLGHFLQGLGRLWVAGRDFDAGALFADRGLAPVDLDGPPPRDRTRMIDNTLAYVRLPSDVAAGLATDLAADLAGRPGPAPHPGAPGAALAPSPVAPPPVVLPGAPQALSGMAPALPAPPCDPAGQDPAQQDLSGALGGYFGVMQRFLDMQGAVMEAALGAPPATEPQGEPLGEPQDWQPPLLHRIVAQDATCLTAETDFDPLADPFIAQHVLYADRVSDLDPELQALPVLPLAVSLEMALEAAAVLTGQVGTRLEHVRARDWVAFDTGPATLTTEATLCADPLQQTRIGVRLMRDATLLFEAEVVIEPAPPLPDLPALAAPRAPIWRDDQLYATGMFHGPLFRGIASLVQWDAGGPEGGGPEGGGLDARLADLPLDGFFGQDGGRDGGSGRDGGHGAAPGDLLVNPALLDQLGHVTAFWIAQGAGTDFSSFPSSIDRIDLGDARTEATAGALIAGRIGFRDAQDRPVAGPEQARFLQGDFQCTAPDGTLLMRASGWRDRFFRVPHSFFEARYRPRAAFHGSAVAQLAPGDDVTVWSVPAFPPGFLDDAGGIWMRVLACTVLNRAERAQFAALSGPGKRRRDWLVGRIALKEAARDWIARTRGVLLLPADLEIIPAPDGRPCVHSAHPGLTLPEVSLSHAGGAALAAAAPPGRAPGVDMEHLGRADPESLAEGAFGPQERALLGGSDPARLLCGWCAKEAVAKTSGQGLTGRPRSYRLTAMDLSGIESATGSAAVTTPDGACVTVALARTGTAVMALALR